jgi:hypothetical protein
MLYLSGEKDVSVHCLHVQKEDLSFRFFNPSVAVVADRIIVSLRMANLERSDVSRKFYVLPPYTDLKNEIVIGEFDADFACLRQFNVDCRDRKTGMPYNRFGFEDSRIIASPQGVVEGMANLPSSKHKVHPDNEITFDLDFDMKMGRFEFDPDFEIAKVTTYESPFRRRVEKNWSPFFYEGKLCVVYQWYPLILMELIPDGTTRFLKWFHASPQLRKARGSSPGIVTKNGYLFVVHRQLRIEEKLRFSHQFLELGHDLQPLRISEEFSFLSTGLIEYCAGLAQVKGRYLLTFGLNDSLPFLAQVSEECVERLLRPFAEPMAENKAILSASYEEQLTEAAADFPRDYELSRVQLAKFRIKAWLNRARGRELRA